MNLEKSSEKLFIRVTPREKEDLTKAAVHAKGESLSAWVKNTCLRAAANEVAPSVQTPMIHRGLTKSSIQVINFHRK